VLIRKAELLAGRSQPTAPAGGLDAGQLGSAHFLAAVRSRRRQPGGAWQPAARAMRKVEAGPPPPAGATVTWRKNVCTHCSVGCSVLAEVANGV